MNLKKIHSYSRLDILKRKLFLKKVWLVINTFVFLPALSWIFFVWLGPIIDTWKNVALSGWWSFWGIAAVTCQTIFCAYILIKVNTIRDKVESIEWDMDNK